MGQTSVTSDNTAINETNGQQVKAQMISHRFAAIRPRTPQLICIWGVRTVDATTGGFSAIRTWAEPLRLW